MNYELELKKYLNKIYDKKIYDILIKENIEKLSSLNLDEIKSLINSKEVFLGSDLSDFIINLIPEGYDGYLLRKTISKCHNLTHPILYDENGQPLKNYTHNNFAHMLWIDFTNETFIDDLYKKFNKDNFNIYVNENLHNIYDNLLNKVKIFKNENKIIIPYDNNLVDSFKDMLLNKKLDFSYALSVVDMNLLRSHMEKYSIDLSFYDEFDKLEDDLDECLNNFFKFTNEELLNYLTKEEGFILTNDNKLIKLL